MAKYNGNRALGILAENWDSGDSWGSTLDALGATCDFLATVGEGWRIPDDAGYVSDGLYGEDDLREASERYEMNENLAIDYTLIDLACGYWNIGMVEGWDPISISEVADAAWLLSRWANVLKSTGEDY